MDSTIFLARLLGPVILVLGLFVVVYPARVARMGREVLDSEALLLISGVITLPAGLAVVLTHNLWVSGWPVLITLFGWIMILAGIARILLPDLMRSAGGAMLDKPVLITIPGVLMAALGAFLTYQGYFA